MNRITYSYWFLFVVLVLVLVLVLVQFLFSALMAIPFLLFSSVACRHL